MSERVVLAWSGGKDSALALERLATDGRHEPCALVTTVTAGHDRVSMHGVRRALLAAQAAQVGLPLVEAVVPPAASNAAWEAAFATALATVRARHGPVDLVAFGDIFLADVRSYREALLAGLGWRPCFPLWGEDTHALARAFVARGHRAVVVCVDTTQVPGELAGREYDLGFLADLPASADPCGERGEFHTCVYEGPLLARGLELVRGETVLRDGRFRYQDLLLAAGALTPRDGA